MKKSIVFLLVLMVSPAMAVEKSETMIVTATRGAQSIHQALASVTVIERADIERLQAQSIQDILRNIAGINIANNGGLGKTTSLFMRGTESDQVLVLIDGVKVGSASLGTTPFQHIPIALIERIEIIRGPRSSLYGSEAIGGVIQIFTRKQNKAITPIFSITGGRYDTLQTTLGISGRPSNAWFNATTTFTESNGFNACNGTAAGAGCFTDEPDKDGNKNYATTLQFGYQFDYIDIDAHILRTESESDFDGSFVNQSESVVQVFGGTLRYTPIDSIEIKLLAGRSQDEDDSLKDNVFQTRFDTKRDTFSLQNDFFIAEHQQLTLGFDYQEDNIESNNDFTVNSRDNKGGFAMYQGEFSDIQLQLSLRTDDNEQFGEQSTGGISLGFSVAKNYQLTTSFGTAFKAPTFNELYFPGFGNANLNPETSRSIEVGLQAKTDSMQWSIHAYQTNIDNLIAFDSNTFAPANINEAKIVGVELSFAMQYQDLDVNTNFTWLDAKDRASGNALARRAEQSFSIDIDYSIQKVLLGFSLFAEAERFDDFANSQRLKGYAIIDFRGQYKVAKHWLLQTRLENLLDKRYETAAYFNQAGRGVFVTLRYQP